MSSKASKAPSDSRIIGDYETTPLNPAQRSRLHMLGWKDADIVLMTVPAALARIEARSAKPGSKAFIKAQEKKLAEGGIPPPAGLIDHSDEEIEARNAARPEPSGVEVTRDEFTNQCLNAASVESYQMNEYTGQMTKSSDPLNEQLLAMEERFCVYKDGFDKDGKAIKIRVPTRRFRFAHKDDPAEVGPRPEPVYDGKGNLVTNGELFMVWIPTDVWKEGRQEPQLARSRALTGRVEKNKDNLMRSSDEMGPATEGRLEMGKSEANYAP